MARPRWVLHLQAQMWRSLMGIGMFLHKIAPPRPPKPSFTRRIASTVSATEGTFDLHFYVPPKYDSRRRRRRHRHDRHGHHLHSHGPRSKMGNNKDRRYPCIINFHGGGFTLGTATDDARWCATVVEQCDAVVVSVDYRLAPECPFPTAVEDGVDAVLWIAEHAAELGIDADKIALSGFSSGANMAFTVPLRLHDHMTQFSRTLTRDDTSPPQAMGNHAASRATGALAQRPGLAPPQSVADVASASTLSVNRILRSRSASLIPQAQTEAYLSAKAAEFSTTEIPSVSLCAIVPWYPSCDYTQTREQRRATLLIKDHDLPAIFTDLFDESYLHPPATIPLDSPYLSPGIAPTSLLRDALPQEIIMHTCEWDMLLAEDERFRQRLESDELQKHVVYKMVEGVPHGWDKAPNPIKPTPGVKEHYLRACAELRRVFEEVDERKVKAGEGRNNESGYGDGIATGSGSVSGSVSGSGSGSGSISAESSDSDIDHVAMQGRRESNLVR